MKFSRYVRGISFHKLFPLSWLYQPIHIRSFSYIDSPISFFKRSGSHLSSRAVSSQVLSAASVLTIVFGMGTGVSPTRIATGSMLLSFLFFAVHECLHSQDAPHLFAFSSFALCRNLCLGSGEPAPRSFALFRRTAH